jgi:hypothetical protein
VPKPRPQQQQQQQQQQVPQWLQPQPPQRCAHDVPNLPDWCWRRGELQRHDLAELYLPEEIKSVTHSVSANVHHGPLYDSTSNAWIMADRQPPLFFNRQTIMGADERSARIWFKANWTGKTGSQNRWMQFGCRDCGFRTEQIYPHVTRRGEEGMDLLTRACVAFFNQ